MIKLLKGHRGHIVDLGSGDGRIVIEAAKLGLKADGIELNPWLVFYSRLASFRHGVFGETRFFTRDLWKSDLSRYDHVVIFGVESMMGDLELKLSKELSRECRVIACRFPLPSWKPAETIDKGIDTVWLYHQKGQAKFT